MTKTLEETKIQQIDINEIVVNERMRAERDIQPLKDSIENLGGLIHPITIDKEKNLIAGYHRYMACKDLGWSTIPVYIVDIDKELAEIDENLIRSNLSTLETAQQLLKRKEIYEKKYPDSTAENIKRNNFASKREKYMSVYTTKSFTREMANKVNKTQRWVQNHVQIGKNLAPETVNKLKGTSLENNFILLQNISKKGPEEQLKYVETYLLNEYKPKTKKQPKLLNIRYKIDFRLKMVVVNNEWVQLPEGYDIDNKSYNQMIKDMENLSTAN